MTEALPVIARIAVTLTRHSVLRARLRVRQPRTTYLDLMHHNATTIVSSLNADANL